MAKGELEYDDLSDFFERTYEVSSQSDTSWIFTGTSERFGNWTVEFQGSGLDRRRRFSRWRHHHPCHHQEPRRHVTDDCRRPLALGERPRLRLRDSAMTMGATNTAVAATTTSPAMMATTISTARAATIISTARTATTI